MKNIEKNLISWGKVLLIFLLFNYSWLFQLIPVFLFNISLDNISGSTNVLLSAFSSCMMAFILFFIYRKSIREEAKYFFKNFWDCFDIGIVSWTVGLVVMVASNILISTLFDAGVAGNEQSVQSMIASLPWLMVINAGFLAPIVEELVFRKSYEHLIKNKVIYIIISGLIFGLAHVSGNINSWVDYLFIIPYGALGSCFAFSYVKTKSILTPIMFHMIHNTVLVLISIL